MVDKISNDARIYTDVQGLGQLRGKLKNNPTAVKKEVAKQFESMLMQMVMKSMRDANKAFASDLYGNDQMDFYQDIYDKQISLVVTNSSSSIATMIEKNIDQQQGISESKTSSVQAYIPGSDVQPTKENKSTTPNLISSEKPNQTQNVVANEKHLLTKDDFIKQIWPAAKQAAASLGSTPGILVAQAILETDWGKKIVAYNNQSSSNNLFNIKSTSETDKKTHPIETLEQKNGIVVKEKSSFKAYESFKESFMDYVNFIKNNTRYEQAIKKAANPKEYINALQHSGFATDGQYAEKVMSIFSSHSFNELISKME
jgi:flagellar protein FlgJ